MTDLISRDIRQIKLVNGEEILTEVVGEDREELLIRNPLRVHRERVSLGDIAREANMFSRWMSFGDLDEHLINKKHILVECLVNDAVAVYYRSMMSNIEEDLKTPISSASEAKEPDVVRNPIAASYDDEEPPTFH